MQITLYTAFWCPDCRIAKRFLDKHQITYQEIDIETTPGAAQEVIRRTGKRAIPQLVIDGEWFQPYRPGEGFLYQEISERLGLTQYQPLRATARRNWICNRRTSPSVP